MQDWDGKGLVSTEWVAAHLDDPDLRIFDATVHLRPATPGPYVIESGRADYEAAHVPGAAFADLVTDLSDTASKLNFTRPVAGQLAQALGRAGARRGAKVVVYSSTTPMWATRLWWLLRSAGFEDVAVMNGGLAKWSAEGRVVEAGTRAYPPADLSLVERTDAWADKAEVLAAIDDGGVYTINALAPSVHSGEAAMSYGRKGHIKGSINVREILSDTIGLIVSLVGLVLTTQAAAENSDFTHSPAAVLSAAVFGAVVGIVLYRWGQAQEVSAVAGQRGTIPSSKKL